MRRILMAGLLSIAVLVSGAGSASAQQCNASGFPQHDMAGVYIDPASPMRAEVYPCGGVLITWDNASGRHAAGYYSFDRLVGHGVLARGFQADPLTGGYLDGSTNIALKAGDPGYINVGTFTPYDDTVRVYRLRKV